MTTVYTKDDLQQEAYQAWALHDFKGLIAAATGAGKTKLGIIAAQDVYSMYGESTDIVIVSPFRKLLDETWPEEFQNWGCADLWKYVTPVTYISLNELEKRKRSLIILDEAHHLTKRAFSFFDKNPQDRILMLSATPPIGRFDEDGNIDYINALGGTIFSYPLDQGVEDGLIADYRIHIVDCFLDRKEKYIPAGTKAKPFLTTEYEAYNFLEKQIKKA